MGILVLNCVYSSLCEFIVIRTKLMGKLDQYKQDIEHDMDLLQAMMESNKHISEPGKVIEHLSKIRYKWVFLSEEDRDYIHGCDTAIEEGIRWNDN